MARGFSIYKNSVGATAVSILGYGLLMMGVMLAVSEDLISGIVMAVLGILLELWAPTISRNKQFKKWIKQLREKGVEAEIRSDINAAIRVYNSNPCKKTLAYIGTLNPAAAENITKQLLAKAQ